MLFLVEMNEFSHKLLCCLSPLFSAIISSQPKSTYLVKQLNDSLLFVKSILLERGLIMKKIIALFMFCITAWVLGIAIVFLVINKMLFQ